MLLGSLSRWDASNVEISPGMPVDVYGRAKASDRGLLSVPRAGGIVSVSIEPFIAWPGGRKGGSSSFVSNVRPEVVMKEHKGYRLYSSGHVRVFCARCGRPREHKARSRGSGWFRMSPRKCQATSQ